MAKSEKATGKTRIKEVEKEIEKLRGDNNTILERGQLLQQQLAQNNTQIIKLQGALEELQRQAKE